MRRFSKSSIAAVVLLVLLGGSGAFATPPIAFATRTDAFSSTSTASVHVPLRNDGTTTLQFTTTVANQTVVIIYNAECDVAGARGTRLSIRILVDGAEAQPAVGTDFVFCSAVDATGSTWRSAVRQVALKVPDAGNHIVKVAARLRGGTGTWRLDDSSLVVQRALATFAAREDHFQSSTLAVTKIPIKQNGGKTLVFTTDAPNERYKITYNAECVLAADQPGRILLSQILVPDAVDPSTGFDILCHSVDTTGKTWAGAARQRVATIPEAGDHTIQVEGLLNVGPGTWRLDDSSLVVTKQVLAFSINETAISTSSTVETEVPIESGGETVLQFNTTKPNQAVKITYNALCRVAGVRGRWLGIRLDVDGAEPQPASGYDFAYCSSVMAGFFYYAAGYRQSIITIPAPGVHELRIFARVSGTASWAWLRCR